MPVVTTKWEIGERVEVLFYVQPVRVNWLKVTSNTVVVYLKERPTVIP